MTFQYRPSKSFTDRHGLFVSLTGGTNSGKTYSSLRLARGIAGPQGKVAVLDTEGGRTLHLKANFDFDVNLMDPPFRPRLFAEAAKSAEEAGYDALLIDSFSMEWVGIGGVLDWQEQELSEMVERAKQRQDRRSEYAIREAGKMAAWIKPKGEHKAMVYSFLQRRIPIIFAIRGEESVKPGEKAGDKPVKIFKSVCSPTFPFEVTVSFRLAADRKGYIDLSDPNSWKMEDVHKAIFRDGDLLSEEHGAKLAEWARGAPLSEPAKPAAKKRTWSDVLADIRQHADAAENEGEVEALRGHDLVRLVMDKGAEPVRKQAEIILRDAAERLAQSLDDEAA